MDNQEITIYKVKETGVYALEVGELDDEETYRGRILYYGTKEQIERELRTVFDDIDESDLIIEESEKEAMITHLEEQLEHPIEISEEDIIEECTEEEIEAYEISAYEKSKEKEILDSEKQRIALEKEMNDKVARMKVGNMSIDKIDKSNNISLGGSFNVSDLPSGSEERRIHEEIYGEGKGLENDLNIDKQRFIGIKSHSVGRNTYDDKAGHIEGLSKEEQYRDQLKSHYNNLEKDLSSEYKRKLASIENVKGKDVEVREEIEFVEVEESEEERDKRIREEQEESISLEKIEEELQRKLQKEEQEEIRRNNELKM